MGSQSNADRHMDPHEGESSVEDRGDLAMTRSTIDFGIDLGTTNSTITVIDGTDARVIPNKAGATVTTSAVWIDRRDRLHVGREAKERTLTGDWDNGDLEFKLRMGLGAEGQKTFARSGLVMLPEQLSAEVLKSLKTDVNAAMGEQLISAVITVPAAFEHPSTKATQKAAKLAGFESAPLLLEPVAASLPYGFQSESENVYWFVYDYGGGTFDAALMRVRDGMIDVINHNGDNSLGGKLIDWEIVTRLVMPALNEDFNLPDFRRGNSTWSNVIGRLKFEVEMAKIEVCRTRQPVEIYIEELCEDADGKPVEVVYTLRPEAVEQVTRPYVERSLTLCRRTLEEKGLNGSSLGQILMVGGSTLNPWVREAVESELGAPLEFGIDPVTVVARGAAIFASTQAMPENAVHTVPRGTWRIEIEHEPVGDEPDPDIGGRVVPKGKRSPEGCTIELRDTKTRWSSGRIPLSAEGVFMTQLFAEVKRRCVFEIELLDPSGTRIPVQPDSVIYTIGFKPAPPQSPHTIGIGLANNHMRPLVRKGKSLPVRTMSEHRTTVPLRTGMAEDEVRIPVLEGENDRADRNHCIGYLRIRGNDVRRDLPQGSPVEITVKMDTSLQVRVNAFVPFLDEEFEVDFDAKIVRGSLETLREEFSQQSQRLEEVRDDARDAHCSGVDSAFARIEREQMLEEAESLLDAAETDADALTQLDRRMLDLKAAIDAAEDAVAWPKILEEAEKERESTRKALDTFEEVTNRDHTRMAALERDLDHAVESDDPNLVRRYLDEMIDLRYEILRRNPAFWLMHLEYIEEHKYSLSDIELAERLFGQAQRALSGNDLDALSAAVRQLFSMLPKDQADDVKNRLGSGIL